MKWIATFKRVHIRRRIQITAISDETLFRPLCLLYKHILGSEESGLGIQAFCSLVRSPNNVARIKTLGSHALYS
jgi:hypothetical protein